MVCYKVSFISVTQIFYVYFEVRKFRICFVTIIDNNNVIIMVNISHLNILSLIMFNYPYNYFSYFSAFNTLLLSFN